MSQKNDIQHSILIVSGSEQFNSVVKKALPFGSFMSCDIRKSIALARQTILERYYDIVVINAPLPDEMGIELALDITEQTNASVLLAVPREIYEEVLEKVTDYGILVLSKPLPVERIPQSIRFLMAVQGKLRLLEKKVESAQEKTEELRIIDKAKLLLIEKKHMTEDEAHRYIGKEAMDHGVSRKKIAESILAEL